MNIKIKTEILSLVVTTFLTIIKLVVGFSINSVSVISDGLHSGTDILASAIVLFGVTKSDEPANHRYNYGYGQMENLVSIFVSFFVVGAGCLIIYEAIIKICNIAMHHSTSMTNISYGIWVMLFASLVNFVLSRVIFSFGKKTDSSALKADSFHKLTDTIATFGVFIGLCLMSLTHWSIIDPIASIIVAGIVLWGGYSIFKENVEVLLDISIPKQDKRSIRVILNEYIRQFKSEGKHLSYHGLRTRKAGSDYFIDLHLIVDNSLEFDEVHDLCDDIESSLRGAFPESLNVLIHPEPRVVINSD